MNFLASNRIRAAILAAPFLFLLPASLLAQGSLTPPGAPTPTMKTLTEVEPRIAVQTLTGDATSQFLITQPGSYYLTGNINGVSGKAAIAINADNVTLDLGGHALIGVSGATRAVELRGTRNQIVVRHGSIRTFDAGGITAASGIPSNCRIEGVSLSGIVSGIGIELLGESTRVRDCELLSIGGTGISVSFVSGLVQNCVVRSCSGSDHTIGISANTVDSCTVASIKSTALSAIGINANNVNNCTVSFIDGDDSTGVKCQGAATGCQVFFVGFSTGDSGLATGLSARTVTSCSVNNIGGASNTSAPVGINSPVVVGCEVESIGVTTSTHGATGIMAESVTASRVTIVRGGSSGNVVGISANNVSASNVDTLTQANSNGSVTGISGDVVTGCRLSNIGGASTTTVSGIGASSVARDCTVSNVSNAGSGSAVGLFRSSSNAGSVENCVFRSCGDIGISVFARQRIIGCTISQTPIGILATNVRNVIDGNNIDTATTGISAQSGTNTANALIIRNQVRNSTTNIASDAPCQVGPIVTTSGFISSTNPWANFTD